MKSIPVGSGNFLLVRIVYDSRKCYIINIRLRKRLYYWKMGGVCLYDGIKTECDEGTGETARR